MSPTPTPSHGKKAEVLFNGNDFSLYLNKAGFATTREKSPADHFKTNSKNYTVGLRDDVFSGEGNYDGTPKAIDDLMNQALDSGDNAWTYFPFGSSTFGAPGFSLAGPLTKYEAKSDVGATTSVSVEAQSNRTDRVRALASGIAVSSSGQSSVFDFGVASTATGSLLVHAYTSGGTLTVKLQDSADGSTFADAATATVTGGTVLDPVRSGTRVSTTGNLRRYVRATWSGAGTILVAAAGR